MWRFIRKIKTAAAVLLVFICGLNLQARQITDMAGRTVNVPDNPRRIVALGPGALRLLCYLQAQSLVAGVEDLEKRMPGGRPYRMANPQLAELPSVGPGGPAAINRKPDLEKIMVLKPDLVLGTYFQAATLDSLQASLQVPVVKLGYGNQDGFEENVFFESLKLAGAILHRTERAEALVAFIRQQKKDLQQLVAGSGAGKLRVYVGAVGHRGAHGIESTDLNYLPLQWLPVHNLAADTGSRIGDHVLADKEVLMRLNPDFILIDGGGLELVRADYGRRRTWYESLSAWKNKKVCALFPYNYYTTNVETALVNAWLAAGFLFREKLAETDLRKKAATIFSFMTGVDVYEAMAESFNPLDWTPEDFREQGE